MSRDLAERDLIADGIEAIRLTREYVDPTGELLPPIEGWSWFDWTEKAKAFLAESTSAAPDEEGPLDWRQLHIAYRPGHDDCIATIPHFHDRPYELGDWGPPKP